MFKKEGINMDYEVVELSEQLTYYSCWKICKILLTWGSAPCCTDILERIEQY